MKTLFLTIILIIPLLNVNAQGIGEIVPDKKPEVFPSNAFGGDLMFGEGGLGLGAFYRHQISPIVTLFADISMSEAKDDKEFDYVDIYGIPHTYGKKNRIFLLPLNFGIQYRLFENTLTDNLRPYFNFGAGPSMVFTTPYDKEYINAFGKAHARYTLGGYVGFGANFGLDKSNLVGLNFRYYIIHFFDNGVEGLYGRFNRDLGGFYLTVNIGMMY